MENLPEEIFPRDGQTRFIPIPDAGEGERYAPEPPRPKRKTLE
jgi:hypothetical protein